jgi:hypothetical protein
MFGTGKREVGAMSLETLGPGGFNDPRIFDRELVGEPYSYGSEMCRADSFLRPSFIYWSNKLQVPPHFHRKLWEWVYICSVLQERVMLQPGRRGLGFGVGTEQLPDLFASFGCTIVGTDQAEEGAISGGWAETNQHAGSLEKMRKGISPKATFDANVSFQPVDMNAIPDQLRDFDFCWSACAFEHLGSMRHGMDFVHASLKTLRPGGLAVHTTEFNVASNEDTLETPQLSIYRRRDIEKLVAELREAGHKVAPLNFYSGTHVLEQYVDLPPYHHDPHLRVQVGGYTCTSIGLIISRGGRA